MNSRGPDPQAMYELDSRKLTPFEVYTHSQSPADSMMPRPEEGNSCEIMHSIF